MYIRILSLIISVIITFIVAFYSFILFGAVFLVFFALFGMMIIYSKIKRKFHPPKENIYNDEIKTIIDVTPEDNKSE
jgi:predicted membrane protein